MVDKFGENIVTVNGEKTILPRNRSCNSVNKVIEIAKIFKTSDNYIEAIPYTNTKLFLNSESLLLIKKVIWKKMLNRTQDYNEYCIYSLIYGLKNLGLKLNKGNIDEFITQVRNSIFNYVTFYLDYNTVTLINFISTLSKPKSLVKIRDKTGYIVKPIWTKWVKF